ncbi:MAG: transporter substrate-binding domain-containing protein [Oscillochloris sp.]|nr:transporter substrate-binding domain-containing protein [Oscillochloris sp.]
MHRLPRYALATLLATVALLLVACGSAPAASPTVPATDVPAATTVETTAEATAATAADSTAEVAAEATAETAATDATAAPVASGDDLLAEVKARGKLLIATDSNYAPQSYKNPDNTWEGFDVEVATEIAKRLGVEPEFLDISFDVVTAGSWNGRWDINVGSMTVTAERKAAILFSNPYYYTPAAFAVHKDSTATSVADLDGKVVGVGAGTTYLDYLNGTLTLEGEEIITPAPKVTTQVYDVDTMALDDLSLGDGARLGAALSALPTIENAIKNGKPLKVLGEPVYYEALAVDLDKKSPKDPQSLLDAINKIIDEMHADGTLTTLSEKYYGVDISTKK